MDATLIQNAERRKQVRLKLRSDLIFTTQLYEGKTCQVVKDPISMKYYRFSEREYYVLSLLDGKHTMEEVQKSFERRFRPDRLTLEDLESFARQLVTAGLVIHESQNAAKHLFKQQQKQRRLKRVATLTNILYVKIPLIDPDRLLNWMIKYLGWMFTHWFLLLSVLFMLSAAGLVTMHFQTFYDKLPTYNEFFQFRTLLYMWIALGVVKVIHEFGHGLTCKAFASECHEMGFLLLCLSPALYCNVTDAWTVASKWKRILISFAGIYVELMIAAAATFVWWYTPHMPFINNVSLALMTLCSVSTFVFNANPLMRFDGYYMMSDFLEIPNLRQRANKYITNLAAEKMLGIEQQPEPYMQPSRRVLFVVYAVASYIYRWVITFSIIWFLATWLKPYKLETISWGLATMALGTMFFWPMYRLRKYLKQRGRLPDMKTNRLVTSIAIVTAIVTAFLMVPLPISRVMETGMLQVPEQYQAKVYLSAPGFLEEIRVRDGQPVVKGQLLAVFGNPDMEEQNLKAVSEMQVADGQIRAISAYMADSNDPTDAMDAKLLTEKATAERKMNKNRAAHLLLQQEIDKLQAVKAPRNGRVMSPPRPDQVGQKFDSQALTKPLCTIGEPGHFRVLVPVTPEDYRLLKEDLEQQEEIDVSILVAGRSDHIYSAKLRLSDLPKKDAEQVPLQLTHRGGGTLAVKPSQNPEELAPLSQTYLIPITILDPDDTLRPGILAKVKIKTKWRSLGWWTWRGITSAFDWGLLGS